MLFYRGRLSALNHQNKMALIVGGGGEGRGWTLLYFGRLWALSPHKKNNGGEGRRGRAGLDVISLREVVGPEVPK